MFSALKKQKKNWYQLKKKKKKKKKKDVNLFQVYGWWETGIS